MICDPEQRADALARLGVEHRMFTEMLDLLAREEQWCRGVQQHGFTDAGLPKVCLIGAAAFIAMPLDDRPVSDLDEPPDDATIQSFVLARLAQVVGTRTGGFDAEELAVGKRGDLINIVTDYNDDKDTKHLDVVNVLQQALRDIEVERLIYQPQCNRLGASAPELV